MREGETRRGRLRLLRVAGSEGAAFEPPLLSLSPRNLRRIEAGDERSVTAVSSVREELWVRAEGARMRATIDASGKLALRVEHAGEPFARTMIRVPGTEGGDDGASRYFGRWEHGRDAVVITARGAGVIARPATLTLDREPELADVYEGEGLLLALRNIPNGARVIAAEGVAGIEAEAIVSDVQVPEVERGPNVSVHPREAFLRGFAPTGFEASFAGLDFAGFAPAHGDGSPDLARFLRKPDGIAWGAVRPVEGASEVDALLTTSLAAELAPSPLTGRVRLGKAGTITLSDGRSYRVRAGVREHVPSGAIELVTCALLDSALLVRVGVPFDALIAPDANVVLARLKDFLIGLRATRS